jgi:aminoacylase
MMNLSTEDRRLVNKFREYIRIKTVHPKPDYATAVEFLLDYMRSLHLDARVVTLDNGLSVVIATMKGTESNLPSVLLNSHMDVVPIELSRWTVDPFAADMDAEGRIFGRGTQDMKCVTIETIEALSRMKARGVRFIRDIHVSGKQSCLVTSKRK